jgi:hypothetical protein
MPERFSTRVGYDAWFNNHILPRWGQGNITAVQPRPVELWLRTLPISPKSKVHIRGLLRALGEYSMWRGAPSELSQSSAKCRMKITSRELEEQLQVLSGGSPTQAAQQLVARGANSSLRPRHHSGFAGLRMIPSTHNSGTGT